MALHSSTIDLDAARSLHVTSLGSGRDIVLIHGALTTGQDWLSGPAEELARFGRVHVIDRPGHGRSRRARFEGSPRAQADQIRRGLARASVQRPLLVAHSLGALVALSFAEQHPDEVERIVLVAPLFLPEWRPLEHSLYAPRALPFLGPLFAWSMSNGPDRLALEQIHALMFSPHAPPPRWRDHYPWEWMLGTAAGIANGEDFSAIFPLSPAASIDPARIKVPVHILVGARDKVLMPMLHAEPLARALPDARIEKFEGEGHMLHHTHSAAVIAAVAGVAEQA